jgi:hypothetical protein
MDAVVVEVSPDGQVRYEQEGWSRPTVQERRAIIHAAHQAVEVLEDLIATLEQGRAAEPGERSG